MKGIIKKFIFIVSFILGVFPFLHAEDVTSSVDLRAQALWGAHDYAGAGALFEKLLDKPLPGWQKARVLYNLGTIKLAQHQPAESLEYFSQVSVGDLSLPRFGQDLFLNEALVYMQQADDMATKANKADLDQEAIFMLKSLQALNKADEVGCAVHKEAEKKQESSLCISSPQIASWKEAVNQRLLAIKQQQRDDWIQTASVEYLSLLLIDSMQNLSRRLDELQKDNNPKDSKKSYFQYVKQQSENLLPLWNALQNKSFTPDQKKAFEQAASLYLSLVQGFQANTLADSSGILQQSTGALSGLVGKEQNPLQMAMLHYEIVWLKDQPLPAEIEGLMNEFNAIKQEKNEAMDQTQRDLKNALDALETHQKIESRIYLLAGLCQLQRLAYEKSTSSIIILKHALEQASCMFQLTSLYAMMGTASKSQEAASKLLLEQQQHVLEQAALFVPAVLEEEKTRFNNEANRPEMRCQDTPWDQTIPLFDKGWQNAKKSAELLETSSNTSSEIAYLQQQTVANWSQALDMLTNPPQKKQTKSQGSNTTQDMNDTLRSIQEMFMQDQFKESSDTEELHSW